MSLLTTSAASIHQLAAAAAFAGPPPHSSIDALSSGREEGEVVKNWWGKYNAITNILLSAGWMIEQHTLRTKRHLDQETEGAVRTKDVCVVGAMITNVANVIADQMMKREFPDGVRVTATGALSPDMPAGVGTYLGFFKVIGMLNRVFVAGPSPLLHLSTSLCSTSTNRIRFVAFLRSDVERFCASSKHSLRSHSTA